MGEMVNRRTIGFGAGV